MYFNSSAILISKDQFLTIIQKFDQEAQLLAALDLSNKGIKPADPKLKCQINLRLVLTPTTSISNAK
jgi:hypothetical protein